ncbi:MAG: amidohydrolase family protein [Verrucomicrobia bacterium]|nr:amidohydrolase family protein [Verrucomicrobiota bacterium]
MNRSALTACILLPALLSTAASNLLPPGHRPRPNDAHAFTHARIVLEPGKILTNGTLVIRAGRVEAVGHDAPVPTDARVWNMNGLTLYAGFLDPYHLQAGLSAAVNTTAFNPVTRLREAGLTSSGPAPFLGVPGSESDPGNAGPGEPLSNVTPERRIASSFVPDNKAFQEMRELGFAAACITPEKGLLRGQSALALLGEGQPNDLLLQEDVFQHADFDTDGGKEAAYPKSLMGAIAAWRQAMLDAAHHRTSINSHTQQPDSTPRPPVNPALTALEKVLRREQAMVIEPGSVLMMSRAAQLAREMSIDFVLVASGQEWRRPDLMQVLGAPLIVPVAFPGIPKLDSEEDWGEVSLDALRAWDWASENPALLRNLGLELAFTTHGLVDRSDFRTNLRRAIDRGLSEDDALAGLTTIPAKLCKATRYLGTIAAGKLANLTIVNGSYFDPKARVVEVWVEGRRHIVKEGESPSPKPADAEKSKPKKDSNEAQTRVARKPAEGRGPLTDLNSGVLIEGATLWTCGAHGKIENGSLAAMNGKIVAVGKSITLPESAGKSWTKVDGRGLHITPGLIDAHSHSMILGGVNEPTLPSTAMVRIGDVINSEAGTIAQQLAGGLTTANQLHGSANPIGGQNQVIKLRDGASPEGLKFEGAPEGIKFALGENVKQANWGEKNTTRFPQTRMGVGTFFANRFTAARQYQEAWATHRSRGGPTPRRDLELEAVVEILEGKRLIHCHSYRQDEILAFLRVMEQFNVKVATLQHVLEGYKVADEIARHGAGASCFADWWAYKFEVYDAIPHAGSLMRDRGVLVSFNSDSSDLARRMNLEAAKAVKYGNTPEEEALKFVTLNPARQLRIDSRVGSLETGKDADFAVWSGHPLSTLSTCLQTWIDGVKYFDKASSLERSKQLALERTQLVEKARRQGKPADDPSTSDAARAAFFRRVLETARHSEAFQCDDCQPRRFMP